MSAEPSNKAALMDPSAFYKMQKGIRELGFTWSDIGIRRYGS
jgi:hypothetical protein